MLGQPDGAVNVCAASARRPLAARISALQQLGAHHVLAGVGLGASFSDCVAKLQASSSRPSARAFSSGAGVTGFSPTR